MTPSYARKLSATWKSVPTAAHNMIASKKRSIFTAKLALNRTPYPVRLRNGSIRYSH